MSAADVETMSVWALNLNLMVNRARNRKRALAPFCGWFAAQLVKCATMAFRATSVLVGRLSER